MLTCVLSGQTLSMAGELQVQYLDSLKGTLEQARAVTQPLEVDLTGVGEVDLAGLQMLLAFARARDGVGATRLTGFQPTVTKALALTGLDSLLDAYMG